MANKQRLNSLDRFRKQPGRLVLEQHSHCEVPAGCGGVVLRWRNPLALVPVVTYLYSPSEQVATFLDGAPLTVSRTDLAPGRHVVAFHIADIDLTGGVFMFLAIHQPKDYQRDLPSGVVEKPWKLWSVADNTWKFTLDAPAADRWTAPDFDDSGWHAQFVKAPTPKLEWNQHGSHACSWCDKHGAKFLRIGGVFAPKEGDIWIRKAFDVPAPEVRAP
jgi:hypothetical protein